MSKPRGFTLIELLVVIAIVALLIGILVPYLGRGRFVGQTTVCQSNMKQMVQTCTTYAISNKNWFPNDNWASSSTKFNPNMVSVGILNNFNSYGLRWTIWFCPLRQLQLTSSMTIATPTPSGATTADQDAINKIFEAGTGTMGTTGSYFFPNFYWAPRNSGATTIPDPVNDTKVGSFPFKTAQSIGTNRKPLFSDLVQDTVAPTATWPNSTTLWGGHYYRQLDGAAAGFTDGSAERRTAPQLKLSFNNPTGMWNFY